MATKQDKNLERTTEKRFEKLKFMRRGKKGAITKRIEKLEKLVEENGSRRIAKGLLKALQVVFEELQKVCNEISFISDEIDEFNCLETIRMNVDESAENVLNYLEERKDDPASSGTLSLTGSWVNKYCGEQKEELSLKESVHGNSDFGSVVSDEDGIGKGTRKKDSSGDEQSGIPSSYVDNNICHSSESVVTEASGYDRQKIPEVEDGFMNQYNEIFRSDPLNPLNGIDDTRPQKEFHVFNTMHVRDFKNLTQIRVEVEVSLHFLVPIFPTHILPHPPTDCSPAPVC